MPFPHCLGYFFFWGFFIFPWENIIGSYGHIVGTQEFSDNVFVDVYQIVVCCFKDSFLNYKVVGHTWQWTRSSVVTRSNLLSLPGSSFAVLSMEFLF